MNCINSAGREIDINITITEVNYDFYNNHRARFSADSEYGQLTICAHQHEVRNLKSSLIQMFAYEINKKLVNEKGMYDAGYRNPLEIDKMPKVISEHKLKSIINIVNYDEVYEEIKEVFNIRNKYLRDTQRVYKQYDNKLVEFFNKNRNLKILNSKGYITNPNVEIGEQ